MENNAGFTNNKKALEIFKWSLRKNLPFSIAYWILLFLTFPMIEIFMMVVANSYGTFKEYISGIKQAVNYLPSTVFAGVAIVFSIIMSVKAFSYMHNKRRVDFFGSLPVSRRTLFFMRYLSTLAVCIVPVIVFGFIGALMGCCNFAIITTAKVVGVLIITIIGNVSFIAFISLCCGTVVDVIMSYAIINIVYPICVAIAYFFPPSVIPGLSREEIPITIFTFLVPSASFYTNYFSFSKVLGIVWWLGLSIVLMSACFVLCRKRKAETAQNAFAFNAVEIVIKFFTCFASGFGIGYMCAYLGAEHIKSQYIWFVVGAVIAIMTANILLHLIFHRGLSQFKSSLVECGAVFACLMTFLLLVTSGGLGYEKRMPNKNDIKAVSFRMGYEERFIINGRDLLKSFTEDTEIINDAYAVHQAIVNGIQEQKGLLSITPYYAYGDEIYDSVHITYELKNGKHFTRHYTQYRNRKDTKDLIDKIVASNYYSKLNNPYEKIPEKYIYEMELNWYIARDNQEDDDVIMADQYSVARAELDMNISFLYFDEDKTKIAAIASALRKDVDKNGIYVPKPEEKVLGITISYRKNKNGDYDEDACVSAVLFIPATYTNTIKLLKEYGYMNQAYSYLNEIGSVCYTEGEEKKEDAGRKVYFTVPEDWDKKLEVNCMLFKDEDMFCELDAESTKCNQVSDRVWFYTFPDFEKYETDWEEYEDMKNFSPTAIMFYQHDKEKMYMTGAVELPKKYNGKMLSVENLIDTNYRHFRDPMYDKNTWEKFQIK